MLLCKRGKGAEGMSKNFQPRRVTIKRLGVSERTVARYERDGAKTGFPQPLVVNGRKLDCIEEFEAWTASRRGGAAAVARGAEPRNQEI